MFFALAIQTFKRLRPFPAAALIVLAVSCEKPAGPGGRASIKGQVIEKTYDEGFRVLQSELPAADEDVYITYGNDEIASDDKKTSPEGKFEFKYLSKGDYSIYVYSEDNTGTAASGIIPVVNAVSLSSNDQEADLGEIIIYKTLSIDEGNAGLAGQVFQVTYSKGFGYILDTIYGQDLDVFLVYEDDPQYFDRIRTMYDGTFAFQNLIQGTYRVFIYADDVSGGSEMIPVEKSITINAATGLFDAGILYRPVED